MKNPLPEPMPMETDPALAAAWLSERAVEFLDCREVDEREIVSIDPSVFIPMGEIPLRFEELPKDKPLVVYCHHGMRSLQVAHFLRRAGFPDATSMRGGVDAWSREIDPGLPQY